MIGRSLAELATLVGGVAQGDLRRPIERVSIDSRDLSAGTLFVALPGRLHDGHRFVEEALARGAVAAMVDERPGFAGGLPLLRVRSPLAALQRLAAWHRRERLGRVVAITGSNGKTITKNALARLLGPGAAVSPGSYNSQLGVALSLLAAPAGAALGVFEAGISSPGEMAALRSMLEPDCGVLTNIGLSHIASFRDQRHLLAEKLSLFAGLTGWLLLPEDPLVRAEASEVAGARWASEVAPWGEGVRPDEAGVRLWLRFDGERHEVLLRARSPELVDDMLLAAKAASLLGVAPGDIAARLHNHAPPPTRVEVWRSPGGVTLVNDALSSDPLSVRAALRATSSLAAAGRKILVFGGMGELGPRAETEHRVVGEAAAEQGFRHLLLLPGEHQEATAAAFAQRSPGGQVTRVPSREALPALLSATARAGDVVLLKGPRAQGIAEVAGELFGAMAPSRLVVDLRAVSENISRFRARYPGTKILAVVKALAYGSALAEVAQGVGQLPVDFLGVTTADEGALLRSSGVTLPILVTLVTPDEAAKVPPLRLTVSLSNFSLIEPLSRAAQRAGVDVDVHLKIDTGMGRLGVLPHEAVALARAASAAPGLRVTGVMTHFAAADDPAMDDLSRLQIARFDEAIGALAAGGFAGLLAHASASAGAARFPEARYGMVRLGLALHGVAPSQAAIEAVPLELAVTLVSKIAQIRALPRGWTVGYGATYRVDRDDFRMGVVPVGYHDGLPRSLSNRGWVFVDGHRAPMIGRISMDSVLIDLSDIPGAVEGSDVLFFGRHQGIEARPEAMAEAASTVAYELLARIGPRVQRVFIGA